MKKFIRTAVDLGKNYFQFHGLAGEDGVFVSRKLKRSKVLEFFAQIEPCRVGMEACGSAHQVFEKCEWDRRAAGRAR